MERSPLLVWYALDARARWVQLPADFSRLPVREVVALASGGKAGRAEAKLLRKLDFDQVSRPPQLLTLQRTIRYGWARLFLHE